MSKMKKSWKKKKRKEKRRLIAAKNKELNRLKKSSRRKKANERGLWSMFQELNVAFAKIKENKKINFKREKFNCKF